MASKLEIENKEVSWIVDEISVYGTLTYPKNVKAQAAVVFVAGSGPTDRDWCTPLLPGKNGSAKLLAEALAHCGYATFRYDKRASGPHIQENVTKLIGKISMQSHVDEVAGAVQIILSSCDNDPKNLFVLTNSEGMIHALNYQLKTKSNKFCGLIFTGAPGLSIGGVARNQIQRQLATLPNAEALAKHYDEAVAAFEVGDKVVVDPSLPEGAKMLLLSLSSPANLPFSRELWVYNPTEYIAKVQKPILVVIGKKDAQINWKVDGKALENATKDKKNITFAYPENANHVLKYEEKSPCELSPADLSIRYNAEDRRLDEETLSCILGWLAKETASSVS